MLMMPKCREASRLVSASMDRKLPLFQRVVLRLHLRMCKYCHRFEQQLLKIRQISRHINQHIEHLDTSISLSDEARKRMQSAIKTHSGTF
ncbi:MAG: zf-HC2 domain-containing protein [Desulfobacterales bacterium]|nr:zf-HC2 domain-containing protein [Desulfobacterales bacterium]